jgi:hypothetical protein
MPKELERKLAQTASKRGYGKKRRNAYIYGALRRMGWKPQRER